MERKAIIFDFDDTIVHLDVAWQSVRRSLRKLAEEEGFSVVPRSALMDVANSLSINPSMKRRVDELIGQHEKECVDAARYCAFPTIIDLVRDLHEAQLDMAILSGNMTFTVEHVLGELRLAHCFRHVCGRDRLQNPKPHPGALRHVISLLGTSTNNAVFVGDSQTDKKTADAASVAFVLVRTNNKNDAERIRKLMLA